MNHALENTTNPVVNLVMIGTPQLKLVHRSVQVLINILVPDGGIPAEVAQLAMVYIQLVLVLADMNGVAIHARLVQVLINIHALEQVIPAEVARLVAENIIRPVNALIIISGVENHVPSRMTV